MPGQGSQFKWIVRYDREIRELDNKKNMPDGRVYTGLKERDKIEVGIALILAGVIVSSLLLVPILF